VRLRQLLVLPALLLPVLLALPWRLESRPVQLLEQQQVLLVRQRRRPARQQQLCTILLRLYGRRKRLSW